MTMPVPLFGTLGSLDELFKAYIFVPPNYSAQLFPLLGLPGSIDGDTREYLHVLPQAHVLDESRRRCCNRHLGGFRSFHSEYWTKQHLLPIHAYDFAKVTSIFIAVVPIWELSRFSRSAEPLQEQGLLLSSSYRRRGPNARHTLRMNDDANPAARPA